MSVWSFDQICKIVNGRWMSQPTDDAFDFGGVAIDTRSLVAGQIFIAFVGEHADGHKFIAQAAAAGASMCIVTDQSKVPTDIELPVLVVDDPIIAITELAVVWRSMLSAKVIAITGSNGKTTTCRLVHALCARSGKSFVSQKSFNNELGVPITVLNTPSDAKYLIAELGTSSPGEIAQRAALIKPDIAVITSIGSAHLEELGDRQGVANEKAEIIRALSPGAFAVIPAGIEELEQAISTMQRPNRIVRVDANVVEIIETDSAHTSFTLDGEPFEVPMLGVHNAMNASLAIEVGRALGIDDDAIRDGLQKTTPPAMRLERIEIATATDPIIIYNDAYNANPDSMRAALDTFDAIKCGSPKIAILGDMLELGAHSIAEHQAIVDTLMQVKSIDRLILVGECFAQATTSLDRISQISSINDKSMTNIAGMIAPGSAVLLKGSRGVELERIVHILREQHQSEKQRSNIHPETAGK